MISKVETSKFSMDAGIISSACRSVNELISLSISVIAENNFSSNVEDLIKAQEFLNSNYQPATLMVGHSLGGAATLAAATKLNDIKAVVTIGAPSNVANIQRHFSDVDII